MKLLQKLREKVDRHRRATQVLLEDMCKVRTILLERGDVDTAKSVEQACVRMHEIERIFDNVDTCLFEDP